MLSRRYKISQKLFTKVYAQGKKHSSLFFRVITDAQENPAFAVVISKKVIRGALWRNKEKRRIYTLLQKWVDRVSGATIIILHKDTRDLSYFNLEEELTKVLSGK